MALLEMAARMVIGNMVIGKRVAHASRKESGYTYLAVVFLVAIMGVMLAAGAQVWQQAAQREKERELLFIGNEFRKAIGQYYQRSPGTVKKFPNTLDDLLKDERQLATQRYLRKIYRDPFTGNTEWGLLQVAGSGIAGVYSLSQAAPLKSSNFRLADVAFEGADKYSDWQFVYAAPK